MKNPNQVVVDSNKFLKAIRIASKFSSRTGCLDIIKNIHIFVDGSKIRLAATDMDNTVSVEVPISDGGCKFMGAVSPSKLLNAVKKTEENGFVNIVFGKEIAFGKVEQITLKSAETLHEFEPPKGKNIGSGIAKNAGIIVDALLPFASRDPARYVLNTIYVSPTELVATDGRRIAVAHPTNKHGTFQLKSKVGGIMFSYKSCLLIGSVGNNLKLDVIGTDKEALHVHSISVSKGGEKIEAWFRCVGGTFPNWKQVIPNEVKQSFMIDSKRLIDALGTADVISVNDSHEGVDLFVEKNKIVVKSLVPDLGHVDHVDVPIVNGNDGRIRLCSTYLRNAIDASLDDEIKISLIDEMSPIVIEPKNGWMKSVIMPLRIT
jgi:DNA polymerase III sliding clamp (beta) subunit (PCNA family)